MLRKAVAWVSCALALLLAVGTLSCFGDQRQADEYCAQAIKALGQGDAQQAKALCDKAIEVGGDYGPAYTLRGVVLETQRDGRDAAFRDYYKGRELTLRVELQQADAQYPGEGNVERLVERGRVYLAHWDLANAEGELLKAIALDRDSLLAYHALGVVRLSVKDVAGAHRCGEEELQAANRVLVAHPDDVLARIVRLQVAAGQEKPTDQAKADLQFAMAHAGDDPRAAMLLGGILAAFGINEKAIECFDAGLKVGKDAHLLGALWDMRGTTHRTMGDRQTAIQDFTQEIRVCPTLYTGYTNRAAIYWDQDDDGRALTDATTAVALAPTNGAVLTNRGNIRQHMNDAGAALDFAEAKRLGYKPE